ncbi:Hypothetical predicted protein [Olea europaea subsp. europaea]|uniref:Arginine/serine-rich coiled-coil protein 2 n=1 Tax=Olea europaea subsp. europaea TaxID=158383 RepID=A0A8S0PUY6_OLEEU|nr:Hypothetical predicted protein [Olea europaea subsp. europaea]
MDSNTHEIVDPKAEFRKPLNDSGNRKYRRRSPLNGSSSSSGGSPGRERISSPIRSRKVVEEIDGDKRRRDGHKDLDKDLSRSQHSRSGELHKHSDRQSSRNSHSYHTHDDYRRRDKHVDDYDRDYPKSSSRSDRNSRDYYNSNHSSRDYEHRSREYSRDVDKYSREKSDNLGHRSRDKDKDSSSDRAGSGRRYTSFEEGKFGERYRHREDRDGRDGKADHRRGLGDYRNDRLKEASRRETKEFDGEKYTIEETKRFDDRDKYKEQHSEEPEEHSEDRKALSSKDQEPIAKKPKLFSSDSAGSGKANLADGQSSSSKQAQVSSGKVPSEQAYVTDSDIDAAKTAAMKAAELVNKNLVGTGYMSTDQKKKLLWGNKKSTTTEEVFLIVLLSSHLSAIPSYSPNSTSVKFIFHILVFIWMNEGKRNLFNFSYSIVYVDFQKWRQQMFCLILSKLARDLQKWHQQSPA